MKKLLILSAVAFAAMTSCSNDETVAVNSDQAIKFDAYTYKTTKAGETTTATIEDFGVFAYYDADAAGMAATLNPGYMYNFEVSTADAGVTWTYSPEKYWPSSGELHFFAYSPYKAAITADPFNFTPAAKGTAGAPVLVYTVGATAAAQEDLLVAKATDQVKVGSPAAPVDMVFDHALSQIVFSARSGKESLTFDIQEIKIVRAKNKGTIDLSAATIVWNALDGAADYTAVLSNNTDLVYSTAAYTSLTAADAALMIMPQTLAGAAFGTPGDYTDPGTGNYLYIQYGAKDVDTGAQIIADNTVKAIPLNITLDPMKKYNFQLELTGEALEPITFTVDVNPWDAVIDTPLGL